MIAFCLYASTERQQAAQATGQEEGARGFSSFSACRIELQTRLILVLCIYS